MSYRRRVARRRKPTVALGAGEGLGAYILLYFGALAAGGLGVAAVSGVVAERMTGSGKTGRRVALGVAVGEVALAGAYYAYVQHRNEQQSQANVAAMAAHAQAVTAALAAGTPATAHTDAACQQGIAAGTAGSSCYSCATGLRVAYRPADRRFVCVSNSAPVI